MERVWVVFFAVAATFAAAPPSRVAALNRLGNSYLDQGQFSQAEAVFEQALAMVQTQRAESTADGADVLNNLGLAYKQEGRLENAEDLYRRALAVCRQISDVPREVAVLNNLAAVLTDRQLYKEAAQTARQAIALAAKSLGAGNPELAVSYGNLAKLLIARRDFSAAERLLRQAEQIDRVNFPPDHLRIGYDLCLEGVAAAGRKHYAEAERLYQQADTILEKTLPANHPETGKLAARIANVYWLQGRLDESESMYRRALTILQQAWGPESPRLVTFLQSYETVLRARREFAEAESVEVRTTRIRVVQALRDSN